MKKEKSTKNWKRITTNLIILIFSILFTISISFATNFQMEWGNTTSTGENWIQINLTNSYTSPIVTITPEYTTTSQAYGVSTWVTNVTSNSFLYRTSNENLNNTDNIKVHYIVMEEGSWTLPDSTIKIEAGKQSTNKVGTSTTGWTCPTSGETITFTNTFNANPLVISTRGSNNNPNSWATTFQNDPATSTATVTTSKMCQGLSQSKAITPGSIVSNETIYWIAADEGNGTINNIEFEILWNLQDTGTSGTNWINGYADAKPFFQNWAHTWIGAPNVIIASQTSVGGSDGSWPVIYDIGNTVSIRMFVDEANERSHAGSESGGGWAFDSAGNYGNEYPQNKYINFTKSQIFMNEINTINATVTDQNGNNTINSVITSIINPNSTIFNISLYPEIINKTLTSVDAETGVSNYTAITNGEIIGESGKIELFNRTSKLITFTRTYSQTPIIIAVPSSQNNDNSPLVPIINSINKTNANISLCRDNAATTCDNNYLAENISYVIFDINKTNNYSWIEVGYKNALTNGGAVGITFNKTFINPPYVWGQAQTYNINSIVTNGISASQWFSSPTTTSINIHGCDHPGIGNSCGGTATENFAYLAIDTANNKLKDFVSGSIGITNSVWTSIIFGRSYNNPVILVQTNSDNGAQDPKYPWAKSLTSTGANIRYCEADGINYCDSHTSEVTRWFSLESGNIGVGNGGNDIEKNISISTYQNMFNQVTHNISNITININVIKYNNSGSIARGNNAADLEIEMGIGVNQFKNIGLVNVTTTRIYSIFVNDTQILNAWKNKNMRNIKINGVNFDYVSSTQIDKIFWNLTTVDVNYKNYTSSWTANFSNTSVCGVYNLTNMYSTDSGNLINQTSYTNINFTIPCGPVVKLIYPINYTKIITNKSIEFKWFVNSIDMNLSCDLYINSIFNKSITCISGINNSINLSLNRGLYNWTINATDSLNLSTKPIDEFFWNIINYGTRISKQILFENINQYIIKLNISSLLTDTISIINPIDFKDVWFTAGSFNPMYDFTNTTIGNYFGRYYGWNLNINSNNSQQINYSIAGIGDYNLEKNYIISLE